MAMIPGRLLLRLAALLCDRRWLENTVEPAIADWQREYFHAAGRAARCLVYGRGAAAAMSVIALTSARLPVLADADRRLLRRTLISTAWLVLAISVVFIAIPLFSIFGVRPSALRLSFLLTLIPQAVPLAIPIGIVVGFAVSSAGRVERGIARHLLLSAAFASLMCFGVLGWGLPAGNNAFREMAYAALHPEPTSRRPVLQKGPNEFTVGELRRNATEAGRYGDLARARRAWFSYHQRLSLAAASVSLVAVLLVLAVERRRMRTLMAVLACVSYWALMYVGELATHRAGVAPLLGAWLPNLAALLTAALLGLRTAHGPLTMAH